MSNRLHCAKKVRGAVWKRPLITFLRTGFGGFGLPLTVALALCGCAPAMPPVTQSQVALAPDGPASGPAYGTVSAVRPVHGYGATGSDPQAAILAAMGMASTTGGTLSEIVVHMDNGGTLSVVQRHAADPAPVEKVGERVMVLPGGQPRLVAAPTAS